MGINSPGRARRLVSILDPRSTVESNSRKRAILSFSEKIGLVYFGAVDQQDDEHTLVRGLTFSPTHKDRNYSIGTFAGYDIIIVDRSDTIKFPKKPSRLNKWLIVAIDLKSQDLPHLFLGHGNHSDTFYAHLFASFSHLQRVYFGELGQHSDTFSLYYRVFTHASRAHEVETLLRPDTTRIIGQNFRPLEVELHQGVLYLYADTTIITQQLLEVMVKNGIWLAQRIDEQHRMLTDPNREAS